MNQIWSIAKKELRGYFRSAVAFIFVGAFLGTVWFTFFFVEKFLARGVADVRPLFEWLPVLLIFLVAALTMRLWSEEQKIGTIELLLTLPVPIHRLVLGKFFAALLLIALALALTLGLPITISFMGNLDWGPVIGGYIAALLLAGAYLSIGLCVSSVTDNQIVSLVTTILLCTLLYLPGMAAVGGGESYAVQEILHAIGTGTRFESVARGVIDVRDLAYWGGLIAFGLVLNTILISAKRWSSGTRTRGKRRAAMLTAVLVGLNMIVLSVWLAPFGRARVDLTEDGLYQLSDVTEDLLNSLDEPLLIRGYFSAKSHPLLTPLVPQIRDLLEEYSIEGNDRVRVEFVDPTEDSDLADEALQEFGISSIALEFADHTGETVVNAYFHILIKYGDQNLVLDYSDLIEIRPGPDVGDVTVRLRNLEYDLTRAIKKVAYGFKSLDRVLDSISGKAELAFVVTPDTVPESLKDTVALFEKIGDEIASRSNNKLRFVTENPELKKPAMIEIYKKYDIKPIMSFLGDNAYYFHLVLTVGDRREHIVIKGELSEAAIKDAVDLSLRRVTPGFIRRVGLYVPPPPPPQPPSPMNPRPQQTRPPQSFQLLGQRLAANYEIRHAALTGPVAEDIDVLIVAGPENLATTAQKAIDQFLMRGGAVIVLAGRYRLDTSARGLNVQKVSSGLDDMLKTYGFEIRDKLIMDTKAIKFAVPVIEELKGGLRRQTMKLVSYPFFLNVGRNQMADGHIVTGPLSSTTMHFSSPVSFAQSESVDGAKVEYDALLSSSAEAWLLLGSKVTPDYRLFPDTGFSAPKSIPSKDRGPHALIIAATGTFESHFKPTEGDANDGSERLLETSPPDARLVVIGSSSFASDELAQRGKRDQSEANMQLIENLIDWAIEDVDLLSIRARGSHMRRLDLDDGSRRKWETINAILMLLMLGIVGGVSVFRRKTLLDARFAGGGSSKPHSPDDEQDDEDAEHDGDDEDAIGEEE